MPDASKIALAPTLGDLVEALLDRRRPIPRAPPARARPARRPGRTPVEAINDELARFVSLASGTGR